MLIAKRAMIDSCRARNGDRCHECIYQEKDCKVFRRKYNMKPMEVDWICDRYMLDVSKDHEWIHDPEDKEWFRRGGR